MEVHLSSEQKVVGSNPTEVNTIRVYFIYPYGFENIFLIIEMSAKASEGPGTGGWNRRAEFVNERAAATASAEAEILRIAARRETRRNKPTAAAIAARVTRRKRSHAPSRLSQLNRQAATHRAAHASAAHASAAHASAAGRTPPAAAEASATPDAAASAGSADDNFVTPLPNTLERARRSASSVLKKPSIREESSFKIAKKAQYNNVDLPFSTEWWQHRTGGFERKLTPQEVLKTKQHVFNNYSKTNQASYRSFMRYIETLDGYVRIVTQNMHCRDEGSPGASYIACKAEISFQDNQIERAIQFAELINSGSINAHVIAIQELQHVEARIKFIETLDKTKYGVWLPASGVYFGEGMGAMTMAAIKSTPTAISSMVQTVKASPLKSLAALGGAAVGAVFAAPLLIGTAVVGAAAVAAGTRYAVNREVSAGQGFVWDKRKVNLKQQEFLLFPKEISSGADVAGVGLADYSFKAVAFAQFQLIRPEDPIAASAAMGGAGGPSAPTERIASGAKFSVFNIHPSPYVQSDELATYRSQYEIDMVASHLYQFTLTAKRIKDHLKSQRDYVFVCGDWNVNKYFQNGYSEKGAREDVKIDKVPVVGRGFEEISKKNGEKNITAVEERETCFRDDIPFTNNNNCDFHASGGSEFMTVSEILGTIPPTHLYSISEHDADIPAPYGGKYTWDGLLNSVMYSPYWSSRAFQLLDHIVYSKYGKIPIYAHTMTKRYLTTVPVHATQGPLGKSCRNYSKRYLNYFGGKKIKIPDNLKPYSTSDKVHQYVDIADHYGVECVAILNDTPSIALSMSNHIKDFYTNAKFWMDPFLPTNVDGLCRALAADATAAPTTARGARAASRAAPNGPPITFNKFQIPKLWELLSNTFRNREFMDAKQKLTSEGCIDYIDIIISKIVDKYIRYPDHEQSTIMSYIPENINKAHIFNQFVFKMANRLVEREYLNRIRFDHSLADKIPFGKFVEIAANGESGCRKGNMLYSCKITRKIRNTKNRRRGELLNLADRGQINRFSRRARSSIRSPAINEANAAHIKTIRLKRANLSSAAPLAGKGGQ